MRVLDNFATGRRSNLEDVVEDIELVEADLRDAAAVAQAAAGCELIFHLGALPSVPRSIADPVSTHDVNATGTLNVLIAARDAEVRRVVLASSSSIYGANRELPKRETMQPLPISPYAVAKLSGESYAHSFHEVYGLETVSLRYFNVFGPRQDPRSEYAAVIPRFILAFRHGQSPTIFGDGLQSRDFTYVENVVDANLAAARAPGIGGRVYNIACGGGVSLNEIVERLRDAVGSDLPINHGAARTGDVKHSRADISAAREDLGYEPVVGLSEGIRRTVAYFAEQEDRRESSLPGIMSSVPSSPTLDGAATVGPAAAAPGAVAPGAVAPGARASAKTPRLGGAHVLVTGGAGFIGSHLIEALIAQGCDEEIVILDDLSTGTAENVERLCEHDDVSFVHGSVTDADVVDDLMQSASRCFHLASAVGVQMVVNEPLRTLMQGVRGSNVVMHAAAGYNVPVLFTSTSEVYGKQSRHALTEQDDLVIGSPAKGRWTYAISKTFGEALISGYYRQRGAHATVVRLFNTVGPRQTGMYGMVLPRFVRQALRGDDLTVYNDGLQTRCFTHVQDTVAALLLLAGNEQANGRTFNIGSTSPVTIVDLARRVIEHSGSSSEIRMVPYEQAYAPGFEELGARRPDTSALRELTGWEPQLTLDDAIDDVIAYERERMTGLSGTGAGSAIESVG